MVGGREEVLGAEPMYYVLILALSVCHRHLDSKTSATICPTNNAIDIQSNARNVDARSMKQT